MSVEKRDAIDYCCGLKSAFVKNQLTELLKWVNSDVCEADYDYRTDGGAVSETVTIRFKSGFTRKIDVTADSYKGITADVLKRV